MDTGITPNLVSMQGLLQKAARSLCHALGEMLPMLGSDWWAQRVYGKLSFRQQETVERQGIDHLEQLDLAALLRVLDQNWFELAQSRNWPYEDRNFVKEMQTVRNRWAHAQVTAPSSEDIYRDLDTLQRFLIPLSPDDPLLSEIREAKETVLRKPPSPSPETAFQQQIAPQPERQTTYAPGDVVRLRANPSKSGVVIAAMPGEKETRYHVFLDGGKSSYYESQLMQGDSKDDSMTVASLREFHAHLTALQLLHPGISNLYSLHAARIELIPYQFRPVLKFIRSDRPRLLIADSVGVGKTIEAGLILRELQARRDIRKVLIACPRPLVTEEKWRREMKRFDERFEHLDNPKLRHCISEMDLDGEWPQRYEKAILPFSLLTDEVLHGNGRHRKGLLQLDPPPQFDLMIVDEAHHIRNTNTQCHEAIRFFCENAEAVVFLTATPIQMSDNDLFVLLNTLRPDIIIDKASYDAITEPNAHINQAALCARNGGPDWVEEARETSNLRFHLHAPFASTVARDSVRDCAGNNALRDHLAELLAESMSAIRDQGLLTVRALAVLPNDRDNLSEFYLPLMKRLVTEFTEKDLVPMKRGGHAAANSIFRGTKTLSDLIDDDDMVVLLGDDYATPMWAANPPQRNQREDNFLSMLEIEEWTNDNLESELSKMDDESRAAWMGMKSEEWHQRLYAFLKGHFSKLTNVKVIRISDGTYRKGSNCFFPTDEVEKDDQFPRVAKGVFSSGKNKEQQTDARDFLKSIGVCEVDERVKVEQLLTVYYASELKVPNRKDHYSHLRQFMRFLKDKPDQSGLFKNAYLFMVDGEGSVKCSTPAGVYLDDPFMDTGLRAYYNKSEAKDRKHPHPLSTEYKKSGIRPEALGEFAKGIGAITNLLIENTTVSPKHPDWDFFSCAGGKRRTMGETNENYHIPHLAEFLASPSITKSRLVWRTMKESCRGYSYQYLQARFGRNCSSTNTRSSTLVYDLRKAKWVPQKSGKKCEFVHPRDAVPEKLPNGFEYQTGWQWLRAIEFGKGVEERCEARRRESELQSQEYKHKEQVLREVGFDSLEEAEEMARLRKEDPDFIQRWRESRQAKPAFPERVSADPERRTSKAVEKAAGAPDKRYEKRERSVRTSRTLGKDGVEQYLRDLYTNDDDQLICQICQDEMPFRKKNGKHYFEKVEAFDLSGEHNANHLALCPVCAAKYDEFVFHGPDDARDKLRDAFAQMEDVLVLPVILGEETATIRFVQRHAIDLRAAVQVGQDGARMSRKPT